MSKDMFDVTVSDYMCLAFSSGVYVCCLNVFNLNSGEDMWTRAHADVCAILHVCWSLCMYERLHMCTRGRVDMWICGIMHLCTCAG